MNNTIVSCVINGEARNLAVEPNRSLLDTLRSEAGLTGAKKGCDVGECGSCTVIMNGQSVNSCLVLAMEAEGVDITTIEGLQGADGTLHPLQQAFVDHGAVQCGFCTPGLLMEASALLAENPDPTESEIRFAIAGNMCRCTGYAKVVEAIAAAAAARPEEKVA